MTEILTPPLSHDEYIIVEGTATRYTNYSSIYVLLEWIPASNVLYYNIYRSIQQGGEYSLIASSIETSFYLDTDAPQYKGSISGLDYTYKIAPVNSLGIETPLEYLPEIHISNKISEGIMPMDKIAEEILRRHTLILKTDGIYADIYVRKVAGEYCDCFDPYREAPSKTCLKCYGTGIVGGFIKFENQLVRIAQGNYGIRIQRVAPGLSIQTTPSSWILNYPVLNVGSVIVEKGTNKRWLVSEVSKVFFAGYVTRQEFTPILIQPSDILYKLGEQNGR